MKLATDIVLKLLGVLLFAWADLKSWLLFTESIANKDNCVNAFIETRRKMESPYALF